MPRDPQIDGHDSVLPQPIRTLRLSSAHTLKAKGEGPFILGPLVDERRRLL
jgi:hypothetical protein